jgi:hypothetical protein
MTPEAKKEYDIMAARLASMYGAKWDKDAKANRMVVQAAKVSAWNTAKIKKICARFSLEENAVREMCMKLAAYRRCPLSNILTMCETILRGDLSWDFFVKIVNKEIGAARRAGE